MLDIDHPDSILRTFILFVQASDAAMKYANAHLSRKDGLSAVKFAVLRILAANGGTMTPSRIAEWTFRERHDITTLVDRLERDDLVVREPDHRDRRFVNISLTSRGRTVLDQATPIAREIVDRVMLSISRREVALLERLLRILRENACTGLERVSKRS